LLDKHHPKWHKFSDLWIEELPGEVWDEDEQDEHLILDEYLAHKKRVQKNKTYESKE
jgi:hypothetical protein